MRKTTFVTMVATLVLVGDQLSKWWIRGTLAPGQSVSVLDCCFHIVHARNPGGAFSFLADVDPSLRLPFFLLASAVAVGALLYFLRQVGSRQYLQQFCLAGLLGGAVGNTIDRVLAGHVTDFLDVHWGDLHWPAFNVADSFISVGVVVLIVQSLFVPEEAKTEDRDEEGESEDRRQKTESEM